MKSILKNSLLMLAVAVVATAGNAMAQTADISANPTSLFAGTINDIPGEAPGSAAAYYDPATGDVILTIGEGAISFGILDPGGNINTGNFNGVPGPFTAPLNPAALEPVGFGYLDLNGVLQEFTGTAIVNGVAGGPFNVGAILPSGLATVADFNAFFGNTDETDAGFFFQAGFGDGIGSNVGDSSLQTGLNILSSAAVPEPSSLSLLALAGIGFAARRRR